MKKVICPKCKKEELEFTFAGNNGYVAICGTCKELLYFCTIFSKVTMFKPTGEEIEMSYQVLYN